MVKKAKKKSKKIYIFLALVLIAIGCACLFKDLYDQKIAEENKEKTFEEIKQHYNAYVTVTKDTSLYNKEEKEIGKVYKDTALELEDTELTENTKYFKIKNQEYFISYQDVEPIESMPNVSNRYKSYVVFNENIVTNDETTFYDKEEKPVFTIYQSFDFPIIIKDEDKYGIEYNNQLFYIKKENVKDTKEQENTTEQTRDNIRVLTYHTIYDTKKETCTNTVICHPIEQFDSHMKYISENNYLTLTMKELEMFLDQKIRIPMKSIVVTLDDGKYATNAVEIVEKYKVNATYFIISSRYDIKDIKTTYMDFQSHSYNLHNNYKCPGGEQGGQLLCESEENILNDLAKSKEMLGKDVFAFAYPFFDWNERAKTLLKEAGFRLAFIGQYDSDGFSTYNTDRFMIRRKTIFSDDSVDVLASYLK